MCVCACVRACECACARACVRVCMCACARPRQRVVGVVVGLFVGGTAVYCAEGVKCVFSP